MACRSCGDRIRIIYDTTAFAQPPDSWNVLWDPKYKGKVSVWDDLSTVYMAAQVLGYDKPDPSQLYNLTDDQLEAVKKKLLELKPNIRKMWATGGELTNLFESHEIVIAMGWPLNTADLKKANFPVGETIPRENTTGWIDHLMITAGSENKELAHKFLEYMIEAKTQKLVTDKTHYVPANPQTGQFMTPDEAKTLHLDDVEQLPEAAEFLAECAAAREVYRDLERRKGCTVADRQAHGILAHSHHRRNGEPAVRRETSPAQHAERGQDLRPQYRLAEYFARNCGRRVSDHSRGERFGKNNAAADCCRL